MTLTDFPSYHRLHYPDHPDATPLVVAQREALNPLAAALAALPGAVCGLFALGALVVSLTVLVVGYARPLFLK